MPYNMKLRPEEIKAYHEDGYLFLENVFSQAETDQLLQEMKMVIQEDCPRRILEKNGAIRSFFAPEFTNETFYHTTRTARLVHPSCQLLGSDVYIHQTKLNTKQALVGDWWDWHQDYTFWKKEDGMPTSNVVTAMIFLNDVTEFNGPLLLIPGSHQAGMIDNGENDLGKTTDDNAWFRQYQTSTTYMSALTADLKYTLTQQTIAAWAQKKGIYAAKGAKGSVLFFHGNVFHASSNNLSPWDRHTFLVTYNSVDNALTPMAKQRPDFIANRDFTPIAALADYEPLKTSL